MAGTAIACTLALRISTTRFETDHARPVRKVLMSK
jgi:hypothetical protein